VNLARQRPVLLKVTLIELNDGESRVTFADLQLQVEGHDIEELAGTTFEGPANHLTVTNVRKKRAGDQRG
jgi:hypothetical protein